MIGFLSDPSSYPDRPATIERCETHGALVFLAGGQAYKMKRAVCLPYLDFSTLDKRHRVLARELAINQPHAPEIYLGLTAITRNADGHLEFDGQGEPVEWALRMRRFDQSCILSELVHKGPFAPELSRQLAEAVYRFHETAEVARGAASTDELASIARRIRQALARTSLPHAQDTASRFGELAAQQVEASRDILERRSRQGFVRRCHGDLHLGNIVLWHGAPVLFDAIEFDERLAIIDTLYDLAFLLMDLDIEGQRASASIVLNRYLWLSQQTADLEALRALPLLLALRAGIRAMVAADRARQLVGGKADAANLECRRYAAAAVTHLEPLPPQLVAVGGLSGTGKSTLAASLAPGIGCSPGAVHLRSDLERKAMAGVAETHRLPQESYTPEASRAVYHLLATKAELALAAGHSVVVDAVFAQPAERREIEDIARRLGVAFHGLWLTAPKDVLVARVDRRQGDASDATADVIARQLTYDTGTIAWSLIEAHQGPLATLERARTILSSSNGKP